VDLERGQVTVNGKTGKRSVWLSAEARAVLSRCSRQRTYVFDRTNQRKLFAAAIEAAEISDFHWHDLRTHTLPGLDKAVRRSRSLRARSAMQLSRSRRGTPTLTIKKSKKHCGNFRLSRQARRMSYR
jgi:hypothetical protein